MAMRRLFVLLIVALVAAGAARAQEVRVGDIVISGAWGRPSVGSSPAALYLTLRNEGATPDRLVGVSSPAGRAMLHESYTENGIAKMRMLDRVELPPGQAVVLAPGGLHIMLGHLAGRLGEGDVVPLTLTFEKAGTAEVAVPVGPLGAKGP
ncbi:MAG: copper chaperone PCu(A)C [Rhodospirillaceae bacterium]|nr:copper chaperone PCu(A)C [Rhodospirillaceae bacterium]